MWLIIESPAGREVERRELQPDEVMDTRAAAEDYARAMYRGLAAWDGHIPNCCGDVRVEFREEPDNHVRIFTGESFFFGDDDE